MNGSYVTLISIAGTVWRLCFAVFLFWAIFYFRGDPKATPQDVLTAMVPAVAASGIEIYLRVFRKVLLVRGSQIDVLRRGAVISSFERASVRYWSSSSRTRALIRTLIQAFAALGLLVMSTLGTGAVWLAFGAGLVAIGSSFYDFRNSWQLQAPKPHGVWTLTVTRADAIQILGFDPGVRAPRA